MDDRYIIFEVLIECEIDGTKKYNATSLSDYMNGKSQEECWKIADKFCQDAEIKRGEKWTLCGYSVVDFSKHTNLFEDYKYIIFDILLKYELKDGTIKYDVTTIHDFMCGKSQDECVSIVKNLCDEMSKPFDCGVRKETLCGTNIIDISK